MTSMDAFTDLATGIALETWNIFLDTAPYLFLGFGVAGLLLDFIYLEMGIATTSIAGSVSDLVSQEVKTVFAFLMLLIIAYAMWKGKD